MNLCSALLALSLIVPPPGTWLLPRKDAANTARADIPGKMKTAPKQLWSVGPSQRPLQSAWAIGDDYLLLSGSALERVRPSGKRVWIVPDAGAYTLVGILDFGAKGKAALASVGGGNLVLFDLKDGKRVWRWAPPPKAEQGGPILWKDTSGTWRLALFPQNTLDGTVYEFAAPDIAPKTLWSQSYTGKFWANFGPYGVIADMNNDGRPDILLAAKPSYVAAIDGDTGKILFDLHYPIPDADHNGRPYGLIQAVDVDGDGFRDAVVASCQVEEYVGIVKNVGGKRFELAWAKFIENDLPRDDRELRPNVTSLSDVDGDGVKEFVVGLFNTEGDGKWHTVAFDALGGWKARKLDLPGRYFWGCYDFDGDGRLEILTSDEAERRTAPVTTLHAVEGRTGKDIATLEKATLSTPNRPLPRDTAFYASRTTPTWIETATGKGILVNIGGADRLWRIERGRSQLTPFAANPLSRTVYFATVDTRLVREDRTLGKPAPAISNAHSPLVSFAGGKPELIIARGDGTIEGGQLVIGKPGVLEGAWSVRGVCPAVWIGPMGERLVLAFDLTHDAFHIYRPRAGERNAAPITTVRLPFLPYRIPGMLLPFGDSALKVYVGMKTGVHTLAGALYDQSGKVLWRDDLDGPYPRPAAVVPFVGGPQLVVDDHGKILFYDATGAKAVIAHGWNETIPGRGNGAKYVLPIVGPYGPGGAPRILLASGLENLEILDMTGARLAMTPFGSIYERQFAGSAVLKRPDGGWSLGVLTNKGVFHCTDLADGKDRWTLDLGVLPTHATRVISADIDGNGVEDFLVGLADGSIVALSDGESGGKNLWRVRVDAAIKELVVADTNGDGIAELVVETDDGQVRLFGNPTQGKQNGKGR